MRFNNINELSNEQTAPHNYLKTITRKLNIELTKGRGSL
jgi:hypothetical protein